MREAELPRFQDRSRWGGSHSPFLPHQRRCLLHGGNPRDLPRQRTERTTPVATKSRGLAPKTCVHAYSLIYETCLPPEVNLMCNSKRKRYLVVNNNPLSGLYGRRNSVAVFSAEHTNVHLEQHQYSTAKAWPPLTSLSHAKRPPREYQQRHHRQPELQ